MAEFTQEEATVVRSYVKSLGNDERAKFIKKFQSLSDEGQKTVVGRISAMNQPESVSLPEDRIQPQNIFGGTFNVPGAAIRSAIQGKGYMAGALNPDKVPSFQELMARKASDIASLLPPQYAYGAGMALSTPMQTAGMVGDIATDPASLMAMIGGKVPGVESLGKKLMSTKAAQEFGKFLTRERVPLKNVNRVTNIEKGASFAEDVRRSFVQTKKDAVAKFGKDLDTMVEKSPDNVISLKSVADDITGNINEISSEAKNIFRKTPYLKDALEGTKSNFTVKEIQDAVNYLNTKVPKNIRSNNLDVLDVISDLKATQLEAFPEEMASARAAYAKIIEPYNNVKTQFRFNKVLKSIENNFGGAEGRKAVEGLLPKSIIKEIGGYQKAYETLKHFRTIAPWLGVMAAGSAGGYVAGRVVQGVTNPP